MFLKQKLQETYSGAALVLMLSISTIALSQKYAAPVMLFAILIGLALHPSYDSDNLKPGIDWCARPLLMVGVAMLGFRIDLHNVIELGWSTALITFGVLSITIIVGTLFSRALGLSMRLSVLISGAVSICGVSAAVAICSVLPKSESRERDLALAVAGVTAVSTLAMIVYPLISEWLNHSDLQAGLFIGATIHDVAQVVGAGYSISEQAGNSATFVKLMRVSALLPVVVIIGWLFRDKKSNEQTSKWTLVPPFLLVYVLIACLNSMHVFPKVIVEAGVITSKYCLIASLVAIGLKTNLKSIASMGKRPLISLLLVTVFLAGLTLALIALFMTT